MGCETYMCALERQLERIAYDGLLKINNLRNCVGISIEHVR